MAEELKVIQDFYDFMLWTIRHTEKFPRHHRYSLGVAIENRLQKVLILLLRARYVQKDRTECLSEANVELQCLRYQFRLAKDLRVLPIKSHGYAAKIIDEIGAQVGGWSRKIIK
jgi:hypothetical protein